MYKVEGFVFQTEEEARDARREAEGIQYIICFLIVWIIECWKDDKLFSHIEIDI